MLRDHAKTLVDDLDGIEADMRRLERRVTRIRRVLQREFQIKCWDDQPDATDTLRPLVPAGK